MSILVVGVNHRSGPLPLLERVTIAPEHLGKAVAGLAQRDNVREAVVLSTCNRTEVYVVAELFHGAYGDVRDLLCELGDLTVDELTPHLYSQHDTSAVTHLFEVAAGLDSAVLGESEILGQVRTAWETAQREGAARSTLNQLFRSALSTGKRARSETGIARGTASISHAAVEMITDMIGELNGKRVLVIGAGSMGEGVAIALHRAGGADILVANRSVDRGASLAERVNGVALGFDRLGEAIAASDVIVAGTGAEQAFLTRSLVDDARRSATRPLHIVDIGVPRNVDPSVVELAGVGLSNLDDLRDWADRGLSHRAGEAERVRSIVERGGRELPRRFDSPPSCSARGIDARSSRPHPHPRDRPVRLTSRRTRRAPTRVGRGADAGDRRQVAARAIGASQVAGGYAAGRAQRRGRPRPLRPRMTLP